MPNPLTHKNSGGMPGTRSELDESTSALKCPEISYSELGEQKYLGCGEFCNAHQTTFRGQTVAVKTLKEGKRGQMSAVVDLEREMNLMARMDHPNVIRVVAIGRCDDGIPFLCMELLASVLSADLPKPAEDVSFWKRQQAIKRWPLSRAVHVALGVAQALDYCHNHFSRRYRVFHRDLKPNNIGFRTDGSVVLFDFGVCRLWDRGANGGNEQPNERRPMTGMTGSLRYMAPEVALEQPYNNKAEVFSFASILWEMASHAKPFNWMDAQLYLDHACRRGVRPQLPKKWPTELTTLITQCWSPLPEARPGFEEIVPRLIELQPVVSKAK